MEDSKPTEKVTTFEPTTNEHKAHHTHKDSKRPHPKKKKELTKAFWQYLSLALAIILILVLVNQYELSLDITKAANSDAMEKGEIINDDAEDEGDSAAVGAAVAVAYDPTDYYDESDPMIGDPEASVTIVEFSDFQCPYCSRFYSQTYLALKEDYVDTGKVNIVFRDFPLGFHSEAEPSAIAAECANEQGKFWEFHDMIFENQGDMSASAYLEWAEELELDMDQFESCVESQKYKSEVARDYSDGGRLGVTGTPAFFINGELIVGAQPYSVFAAAIESMLVE